MKLLWQSKLVLLLVMPLTVGSLVLEFHWWAVNLAPVATWTAVLSLLLGAAAWQMRSATLGAAASGAIITASLMFSTAIFPYEPWHTALAPVLAVLVLTSLSTRLGRARKESLGTAEQRHGRVSSQVAANLGVAALVSNQLMQAWLIDAPWISHFGQVATLTLVVGLAALAEAAADTVSSEVGQAYGGQPRMITTLRAVAPGTDGAMSVAGTLAGILAAGIVAVAGTLALRGGLVMLAVSWGAGVFGLLFDSLLGATVERRSWLNNDAVNFLSTLSAAAFAVVLLALLPHTAVH